MLMHLRLNVPTALVDEVLPLVRDNDCVTNVVHLRDASLVPEGDLVECDVAREVASDLLDDLHRVGLSARGGVVMTTPHSTPFAEADRIDRAAPGDPEDAVVWPEVVESAEDAVRPTVTFQAFMVLAVTLAGIAVLTDSTILVVGAMVVGPEFGTVAAVAVGLVFARWAIVWRALVALAGGFGIAVLAVAAMAWVASLTPLVDQDMLARPRPLTGFIWRPDEWSFIVALLAGAAGVLAMSTNRDNAMVGVFISVTTVPAAGNLALALALGDPAEMAGSAQQLGVNLVGMVLAGTAVLVLQRALWKRTLKISDRLRRLRRSATPRQA